MSSSKSRKGPPVQAASRSLNAPGNIVHHVGTEECVSHSVCLGAPRPPLRSVHVHRDTVFGPMVGIRLREPLQDCSRA